MRVVDIAPLDGARFDRGVLLALRGFLRGGIRRYVLREGDRILYAFPVTTDG